MTPKEKAKDLYDKMKGFRVKNSHRKKCALICVDEIIKEHDTDVLEPLDVNRVTYWYEVISEIEKL